MEPKLTRTTALLIVTAFWAVIFLPYLGTPEFKSEEARRVIPAVNMLQTGQWIVPRIGGADYHHKPPGINWLVAAAFVLSGHQNEWSARLVSALALWVWVVVLLGQRSDYLPLRARVIAALIFLTGIGLVEKGRMIEIEAVYICQTGVALLWWLDRELRRANPWPTWLGVGLMLGAGMLTKGPVIVLIFVVTALSVLFFTRRLGALKHPAPWVGMALAAAISYTWAGLAGQRSDAAHMKSRLSAQFFARIIPDDFSWTHWISEPARVLIDFLPWTLFAPLVFVPWFTRRIPPETQPVFRGLRLAWVIGFLMLNLAPATEARYSLPLLTLGSILVGWVLSRPRPELPSDRLWRDLSLMALTIIAGASLSGLVVVQGSWVAILLAVTLTAGALALWALRQRLRGSFTLTMLTAGTVAAAFLLYSVHGVALLQRAEKRRPAAAAVAALVPPGQTLYVYDPGYQSFLFYLRQPVHYLTEPAQVDANVSYLLLEKRHMEDLAGPLDRAGRHPEIMYYLNPRIDGAYRLVRLHASGPSAPTPDRPPH